MSERERDLIRELRLDVESQERWPDDEEIAFPLGEIRAVLAENARLRHELRERRTCLAGAKETCRMAAAVFRNAKSVDALPGYAAAVEERMGLIQQAIDNTDAALASRPSEGAA